MGLFPKKDSVASATNNQITKGGAAGSLFGGSSSKSASATPASTAGTIQIDSEGNLLDAQVHTVDVTGTGVTATEADSKVTLNIAGGGTDVVANPGGSPATDLTTITIGDTDYNVAGDSGTDYLEHIASASIEFLADTETEPNWTLVGSDVDSQWEFLVFGTGNTRTIEMRTVDIDPNISTANFLNVYRAGDSSGTDSWYRITQVREHSSTNTRIVVLLPEISGNATYLDTLRDSNSAVTDVAFWADIKDTRWGKDNVDTDEIVDSEQLAEAIENVRSKEIFWRSGNVHEHIVSLDSDGDLVDIHVADSEYTPEINDVNYVPTGGAIGFHLSVPGETEQSLPFSGGVTLIINTDTHDFELAVPATLPSGVFDALNESTTFVFGLSDVTILRGDTPTETTIYTTFNGRLKSIHNKTAVAELATKTYVDDNAGSITVSETQPSNPSTGDQWFNCKSTVMRMFFYDGSFWVAATPAAGTDSVTDFLFEPQSNGEPVLGDFTGNVRIIYQY